MLKSIRTKLSISGLAIIGVPILLGSSIAGAATLTEKSCKKAKLTLAEVGEVCLVEAQKASPGFVLTAEARAKCEAVFNNGIAAVNARNKDGVACRFINNGDQTMDDLDTRLTWELKGKPDGVRNLKELRDPDNTFTWSEATTDYLKALNQPQAGTCPDTMPLQGCNTAGFAGKQDWRLPTILELAKLFRCDLNSFQCLGFVDPGGVGHEGGPLTILAPGAVWSATGVSGDPSLAYGITSLVDPGSASYVDPTHALPTENYVLGVRGGF